MDSKGHAIAVLLTLLKLLFLPSISPGQVNANVFVMNADGSREHQITQLKVPNINRVRFSPDGSKIVFDAIQESLGEIFIAKSDGSKVKTISSGSLDALPVFTPNGQKILFSGISADGKTSIYSMRLDGTNKALIKQDAIDAEISGDGSKMVFCRVQAGGDAMFVSNADGSQEKQIATKSECNRPSFHPKNNSEILFFTFESVSTIDLNTSRETIVRRDNDVAWEANYSPDGEFIVYCKSSSDHPAKFDIYKMKRDGTEVVKLTNSDGSVNFIEPSYSRDGKTIAFIGLAKLVTRGSAPLR
jgi:Tol biopolymer transport system component